MLWWADELNYKSENELTKLMRMAELTEEKKQIHKKWSGRVWNEKWIIC